MLLCCREDLISAEIEETVARMQVVIELGRYLRDRKVVPVKVGNVIVTRACLMSSTSLQFPLPEVIVVHRDPKCHQQLQLMREYILEVLYTLRVTQSIHTTLQQ